MKKFLLLLSCFLATWCSVQAGLKASTSSSETYGMESSTRQMNSVFAALYGGDGQIRSASYDASNSTIYVSYSLSGASSAKLSLLSTRTGGIVAEYSLSVNASSTSFRVDPKFDEGLYVLLLSVNGNTRSNKDVRITASGSIKSFSPSLNNKELTVSYAFEHASVYSASLRIFNGSSLVKKVTISNPNTTSSITFDSSSLTAGKSYTFKLYSGENEIKPSTKNYTIPLPTGTLTPTYIENGNYAIVKYSLKYSRNNPTIAIYDETGTKIKSIPISNTSTTQTLYLYDTVEPNKTYHIYICENGVKTSINIPFITNTKEDKITALKYNGRIGIDFTLKKSGVNVGFKLISTRTGRTYDYTFGYCGQSTGSYSLSLPSDDNGYHGSIVYVVLLVVDGQIKHDKSIVIYK